MKVNADLPKEIRERRQIMAKNEKSERGRKSSFFLISENQMSFILTVC